MSDHVEAFPLHWPAGWARTPPGRRKRAPFKITPDRAQRDLVLEVRRLGGSHPIISTNIPLRRDGMPYANAMPPEDPGVAVYFTWNGEQRVMACDRYLRVFENIRAVGLSIQALRALTRYGASDILARAFQGFAALPDPNRRDPWAIMGIDRGAAGDHGALRARYVELARTRHPDRGGSDKAMADLAWAYEELQKVVPA